MYYIPPNIKAMLTGTGHSDATANDATKIVEPLSTVIRLAIYSHKPIGTKLSIREFKISYHEPAYLSGVYRCFNGDNKEDIHYLHHPIDIACQQLLTKEKIQSCPKINIVFSMAKEGLIKLKKTYENYPVIGHCIDHYQFLIDYNMTKIEFLEQDKNNLQMLDKYVSKDLSENDSQKYIKMMDVWKDDEINGVIDLLNRITTADDSEKSCYVKALEICLLPIDERVKSKSCVKTLINDD